jgi:hypothetical protein
VPGYGPRRLAPVFDSGGYRTIIKKEKSVNTSILLEGFIQETQQAQGLSIWVWLLILLVIFIVAWLLYRSWQQSAQPVETVERAAPAAVEHARADDLVVIEGIGPKIAAVLNAAGITTFNQLASTDVSTLRAILEREGLRLADPGTWAEQARLAAAGDQAALQAYQDRLKAGRDV